MAIGIHRCSGILELHKPAKKWGEEGRGLEWRSAERCVQTGRDTGRDTEGGGRRHRGGACDRGGVRVTEGVRVTQRGEWGDDARWVERLRGEGRGRGVKWGWDIQ